MAATKRNGNNVITTPRWQYSKRPHPWSCVDNWRGPTRGDAERLLKEAGLPAHEAAVDTWLDLVEQELPAALEALEDEKRKAAEEQKRRFRLAAKRAAERLARDEPLDWAADLVD